MQSVTPTVFLVDDDRVVVRSLERVLATAGHCVRTWTSPGDFLQEHDHEIRGCLVTDLAMPGTSGMELLTALRDVVPLRFVILVSGRGDIPTSVKAMKAGAVTFLPSHA
ncbi:MAG TPA: response regulator [Bryobacteraceae bacterium]|jgi:FixJ family two-component response regulator|nr:response regulator [Bryobacteraceae bacterium]